MLVYVVFGLLFLLFRVLDETVFDKALEKDIERIKYYKSLDANDPKKLIYDAKNELWEAKYFKPKPRYHDYWREYNYFTGEWEDCYLVDPVTPEMLDAWHERVRKAKNNLRELRKKYPNVKVD
jgi:hypothetical protein